jgi:hypothetical protein
MGRLVALAMVVLIGGLVWQAVESDAPTWVSAVSLPLALLAIGLAVLRTFGRARRLGARTSSTAVQSGLARSILHDHLACLAAMSVVLVVQIGGA